MAPGWNGDFCAFDVDAARTRNSTLKDSLSGANAVLSVVTADAALEIGRAHV